MVLFTRLSVLRCLCRVVLCLVMLTVSPVWAEYQVNGNVVLDTSTNLIWMQADDGVQRTWREALAYCENLTLAGTSDWRLPNINELESLVDLERIAPTIDPVFSCRVDSFWSSSPYGGSSYSVWFVDFHSGSAPYGENTIAIRSVRCVRSGP
ncbi:DUF1566 domain-containing protein [Desulfovibrio inopinatus]|uniref:Lcl C-terminal domain-containing protein n=1 Tax=Desulfovibrio inopinatus TaxID=102109 RepID=UPI000486D1DA|nr:DUF1566 domain-containing protein [Desulfovibrio inopinatus]